ncbi:protein cramped-like isoform X1 [Electrophorus electricus]|uniref:protein cramped-like isoform X1 n=2 Tax=Electrophorus electricus TaxID=8005 RepID=UPI0015D04421|nr:protein cramped-like isoform X1 [Electrophorus electricus]
MVKRKKISCAVEELENGMTVGNGGSLGIEGANKPAGKLEACEDEESAEQANEQTSTKRDGEETLHPSTTGSSNSPQTLSTSSPSPSGPQSNPPAFISPPPVPHSQDQHHFLRSSVRPPSKRIRKDINAPTVNGHSGARAKGGDTVPAVSTSGHAGSGGGSGAGGTSRSAPRHQAPVEKDEGGNQKRARRQWESWSTEDKNSFFEGLYEHGKDFEAIQNNIALKYKKKGKPASMVKNKEQVRHFYYRTWHKISKHIDFNNAYSRVLKKSSQELYGLICYAELRKKVGGLMDDKNVAKLNELIQQGATTVRSKGRNLRIKAPMCRALKKLCDPDGVSDEEDQKPVRLPLKVAVELQPRSNHSWTRVQSLAHNPRLRMVVELHRKVSSLIEFLKQKWAIQDQRILKSLAEREALEGVALPGQSEELFLYPAESSTVIALPGVARVVHSKASCTVHWQESGRGRPGVRDLPAAHILGIQPVRGAGKPGKGGLGSGDSKRTEGQAPEGSDSNASAPGAEGNLNLVHNTNTPIPVTSSTTPPSCLGQECSASVTADTVRTSHTQTCASGKAKETVNQGESTMTDHSKEESTPGSGAMTDGALPPPPEPTGRIEEATGTGRSPQQIREEGWSSQGSENVTLAELYLMLGKPGKLQLEYEWQPKPRPSALPSSHRVLRCLLRLVSSEVNPKPALDVCSVGTSPLKPGQEEQSLTPPGKVQPVVTRSPSCGRQQHTARSKFLPNVTGAGARNMPRPLLVAGGDGDGAVFAVPTTLPPNSSRHLRMFSPNKEAELAFRQQLDSISSDIFLLKQRKGRSRPLRKPLVVQRTLLPRTTGDSSQHVCSFSILSNSSATGTGSFRPIQTRLQSTRPTPLKPSPTTVTPSSNQLSSAIDLAAKSAGIIPGSPCQEVESPALGPSLLEPEATAPPVSTAPEPELLQQESEEGSLQNGVAPPSPGGGDSLFAPPSVASLLDISLPGPPDESLPPGESNTHISDSIIELAINSAHYGDGSSLSPPKLNGSDRSKLLPSPSDSPAHSWMPSPTHDPQWYHNDSSDSTLGCLLSSLVSPDKTRRVGMTPAGPSSGTALLGPSLLDSNSHDSFQARGLPDVVEVDTQLACMMSESSVDLIDRFNDLAKELSVSEPSLPPPGV